MTNTKLTEVYLKQPPAVQAPMEEVAYTDIISALHTYFNTDWAWEIADEKVIEDGSGINVMTTVTLFTPGRIFTGRSYCKIKDYSVNHLHALVDACKPFTKVGNVQTTPQQNNVQSSSQQMSADQIAAMLNQSQPQQQVVDNLAQVYNYKDEQGRPTDEVPFDSMTQNCINELHQEMGFPVPQPAPQQSQQNVGKHGYTQAQIDRMNKFKKDFDITNDQMFGNFVNTWDKRLSSKKDINPNNIDAFLDWTDTLGE